MRVMVTGGCGFTRSHVVGHLVGAGHDVAADYAGAAISGAPGIMGPGAREASLEGA